MRPKRSAAGDQAHVRMVAAQLPRAWMRSSPKTTFRAASRTWARGRANLTGIFAQGHVARPVQSILDLPVGAHEGDDGR